MTQIKPIDSLAMCTDILADPHCLQWLLQHELPKINCRAKCPYAVLGFPKEIQLPSLFLLPRRAVLLIPVKCKEIVKYV